MGKCKKIKLKIKVEECVQITELPYVITTPGVYCLAQNLTYTGSGSAITVQSNGVTLYGKSLSITLANPIATGISVGQFTDFTLLDLQILITSGVTPSAQTSIGLNLAGSGNVRINYLMTRGTYYGVLATNVNKMVVEDSMFMNHLGVSPSLPNGTGLVFSACNDVEIFDCDFTGANSDPNGVLLSYGLIPDGSNYIIQRCNFSTDAGILASGNNIQILESNFITPKDSTFSAIALGSTESQATNIIIDAVNILANANNTAPILIFLESGNNAIIKNSSLRFNGIGSPTVINGMIQLGSTKVTPPISFNSAKIMDCVLNGGFGASYGIYLDNGVNLTVDNCDITQSTLAGIYTNLTYNTVIKNCQVSSIESITNSPGPTPGGNGVTMSANTTGSVVDNCQISFCSGAGIGCEGKYCVLTNNNIFGNAADILGTGIYFANGNNTPFNPTSTNQVKNKSPC